MKLLPSVLAISISTVAAHAADFSAEILQKSKAEGYEFTGDAFAKGPYVGNTGEKPRFGGARDLLIWWSGPEKQTGTYTTPPVKLEGVGAKKFVTFGIWGERNDPAVLGVEVLVNGKAVRACTGTEVWDATRTLQWRALSLAEFAGQNVQFRVNDHSTTGSIAVSGFTLSDEPGVGFITDAATPLHERWRPRFHYTARSGWLNDANGLIYVGGTWHLFHQAKPPGAAAVGWGHATSTDLLHWTHQPAAIEPGPEGDAIFSGTAALDEANTLGMNRDGQPAVVLCYTQHPNAKSGRKAVQALAVSTDGARTFQKFAGNPILQTPDNNDRDPKLFYHAPTKAWWMALSLSRNNVDRPHATYGLFRSTDLRAWELRQELGPGGWYWECPDMFALPVEGAPGRTKWVVMKGSGDYLLGSFDGERFTAETPEPIRTSWGASFYGQMTFAHAPGGRRVQMGWMNTTKEEAPNAWPGMPFNQQMSFPRELTLRETPDGLRICREPVREIEQLWGQIRTLRGERLRPGINALQAVAYEAMDLDLTLELGDAKKVQLLLRGQLASYDVAKQKLTLAGKEVPWPAREGVLRLRALLDFTSLELFGNGGEVTHSRVFFAEMPQAEHQLSVEGGTATVRELAVREVKGIWP